MAETKPRMLSARVSDGLFRRVQIFCAREDMHVQAFVIEAATEYLDKYEKTGKRHTSAPHRPN